MILAARIEIDPQEPFHMLGCSYFMALEFTNYLATNLSRSFSATLLWTYPTIAELAAHLAHETGKAVANIQAAHGQIHNVGLQAPTILSNLTNLSAADTHTSLPQNIT